MHRFLFAILIIFSFSCSHSAENQFDPKVTREWWPENTNCEKVTTWRSTQDEHNIYLIASLSECEDKPKTETHTILLRYNIYEEKFSKTPIIRVEQFKAN